VDLRGVGEHRDLRRGAQRVAQGDRVADDGFEIGVHVGSPLPAKVITSGGVESATMRRRVASSCRAHVLAAVEASSARVLGIPAALAVDAVERSRVSRRAGAG